MFSWPSWLHYAASKKVNWLKECTVYSVFIIQSVQYTVSTSNRVYSIQCVHYTVCILYRVYSIQCVHYTECTVYSVYIIQSVQYTVCTSYRVYSIQCVPHKVMRCPVCGEVWQGRTLSTVFTGQSDLHARTLTIHFTSCPTLPWPSRHSLSLEIDGWQSIRTVWLILSCLTSRSGILSSFWKMTKRCSAKLF